MRFTLLLFMVVVGGKEFSKAAEWCGPGVNFKQVASGTCKAYWQCENGTVKYMTCGSLKSFDPSEKKCVWDITGSVCNGNHDGVDDPPADDKWCTVGKTYSAGVNGLCSSYFECNNGDLQLKKCWWMSKFDPIERTCKLDPWPFNRVQCYGEGNQSNPTPAPTSATTERPDKCKGDEKMVYPNNCRKFYTCIGGKTVILNCGFSEFFDPSTLECKYHFPWADCSEVTTQTTTTAITKTTTKTITKTTTARISPTTTTKPPSKNYKPVCNKGESFSAVYPDDCSKFYVCSNGNVTVSECSTFHKFDPITHECTLSLPWSDICSAKPEKPVCKKGNIYSKPYPKDSKKYYNCENGTLAVSECGFMQVFNPLLSACKYQLFGLNLMANTSILKNGINCSGISDSRNISYPGDCRKYGSCNLSQWRTFVCPEGFKFNSGAGKCVYMTQCDLLTCTSEGPLCSSSMDFLAPEPDDCKKYRSCSGGNWTTHSCPWFHKFDPSSLQCRLDLPLHRVNCTASPSCTNRPLVAPQPFSKWTLDAVPEQGKPTCEAGQKFKTVYPKDCSKFYDCANGNLTVKECGFLEKFDPISLECKSYIIHRINCSARPGEPSCKRGDDFSSVYPGDCDRYYFCSNGTLSVSKCHWWQKFDPATLECRINIPYIYSINCSATPGSNKHKRQIPVPVVPATNANVIQRGPKCSEGDKFKATYPGDCGKYFSCSNGSETTDSCFYFHKFNPATLQCRWDLPFYRVNCSAIPGSGLPKPIVYPSKLKEDCKSGKMFKAVKQGHCKSYYSCTNGSLSLEECSLFHKFNPVTLTCSWDLPLDRVNCTALPGQPECSTETGEFKKAYPGQCGKFYQCSKGKLQVIPCGMMQQFDPKTLECQYSFFSTC